MSDHEPSFIDPFEPLSVQADWDGGGGDEQEALAEAFYQITRYNHDRRNYHDQDGYFAELAWSERCIALGHQRDPQAYDGDTYFETEDQLYADGVHAASWDGDSWDGDSICVSTRYGTACVYCEGDCDHDITGPNLWEMVAAHG